MECPSILKDCAEKILKKCEGLPLAIIAVGGLLSQKLACQMEWQKLHDSLELRFELIVPKFEEYTFLKTLDLRQTNVTELPEKIFHLVPCATFVAFDSVTGVKVFEGIGALTYLQNLSAVKVDGCGRTIKELEELTQLWKLGLLQLNREDGVKLCTSIQKMRSLMTRYFFNRQRRVSSSGRNASASSKSSAFVFERGSTKDPGMGSLTSQSVQDWSDVVKIVGQPT
ncbi:hypothetical protein LguiA_023456 [Lonicera macranthoides]